jgi:cellulose synthase/poly-beta-1,6-N-acetylglucosamine synthase-like glycosyltransferase
MIIEIIFWIAFSILIYVFVGYPLGIRMFASLAGNGTGHDESFLPTVSIILSVFNEEEVIEEKIANFLALDYPADMLEIVIVSDCCSDRTEELIRRHESERIRLLVQTDRSGKTRNLNRGVEEARGEILVFTDANAMFDRDAIKNMVRHFADPAVGLVSGKSIYRDASGAVTSGGAYRRYEDFIKEAESRVGGIIGADGAIYAIRRTYYTPLPSQYINDFIHTIQVVLAGGVAISDDMAICREEVVETGSGELRRQTRIMAQSWLIFLSQFGLLLKGGKLLYLWQFVSHKFLRWLTLPLMVLLFVASWALVTEALFYQAVFVCLLIFMMSVLVGCRAKGGFVRVPYLFTLLHYAALVGLFKFLTGNIYTTWNPRNN